jgi:hypothetical protein
LSKILGTRILVFVSEKQEQTQGFQALSKRERSAFIASHFGFLQAALANLQERQVLGRHGHTLTHSTVSRTWYGTFVNPNQAIVDELERMYQTTRRERKAA